MGKWAGGQLGRPRSRGIHGTVGEYRVVRRWRRLCQGKAWSDVDEEAHSGFWLEGGPQRKRKRRRCPRSSCRTKYVVSVGTVSTVNSQHCCHHTVGLVVGSQRLGASVNALPVVALEQLPLRTPRVPAGDAATHTQHP